MSSEPEEKAVMQRVRKMISDAGYLVVDESGRNITYLKDRRRHLATVRISKKRVTVDFWQPLGSNVFSVKDFQG